MKRTLFVIFCALLLVTSAAAYNVLVQSNGDPVALNNAAYYAYHDGNMLASEAALKAAIALDPTYEKARYNLALLLFQEGKYAEAEQHFTWLIRRVPDNAQYHFDYAANYVARFRHEGRASAADFDRAISEYRLADQLSPGFPHAQKNAQVLTKIKEELFN